MNNQFSKTQAKSYHSSFFKTKKFLLVPFYLQNKNLIPTCIKMLRDQPPFTCEEPLAASLFKRRKLCASSTHPLLHFAVAHGPGHGRVTGPANIGSPHSPSLVRAKRRDRASLVAQWLRICLPMQGTRVRALVWEDRTCRGATGPVSHNY